METSNCTLQCFARVMKSGVESSGTAADFWLATTKNLGFESPFELDWAKKRVSFTPDRSTTDARGFFGLRNLVSN